MGKFGGSGCDKDIDFLKITLNKSKSKQNRDSQCFFIKFVVVLRSRITGFKIKITLTLAPG